MLIKDNTFTSGVNNLLLINLIWTCHVSKEKSTIRDATYWSSKSRKLQLPPYLPTLRILLVLLVPRNQSTNLNGPLCPKPAKEEKARIIFASS